MPSPDPIARAREILELSRSVRKPVPPRDQPAFKFELEEALAALIAHAETLDEARQAARDVLTEVRDLARESVSQLAHVTRLLDSLAKLIRERQS